MIQSMTGFGDAAAERDGNRYLVEIKSLNNRYFKPTIKLPDVVSALEPEIESVLRKRVGRGSVVYTLRMKAADTEEKATAAQIDVALLKAYIVQLNTAGVAVSEPERLLGLPGVVKTAAEVEAVEQESDAAAHRDVVIQLTKQAVENLQAMRRREGASLLDELMQHTTVISSHLSAIADRAGNVVNAYHERLLNRVNELMAKAELSVAKADLLKEVAVYAERSDIREELTRLSHHIEQFEDAVRDPAQQHVGRKLDFIAQEMLREANTIGSKANDADIAGRIVEIKGAIDRLKEQVQNVE